jgi:hypothetical protein
MTSAEKADDGGLFNKGMMGYDSPIYTSRVSGRPFLFEEMGDEVLSPASGMCAGKT